MKSQLRLFALIVPLVLIARYALFEDAAEFKRFYAALGTYVLPVLFINLAVLAVVLLTAFTKRINFGPPGDRHKGLFMGKLDHTGGSVCLGNRRRETDHGIIVRHPTAAVAAQE
ncbi:hypothetical protein [Ensifer canadensis]